MQTLEQTALPLRASLLDPVRDTLRCKYYSLRTGQSYIHWIKRFIYLHAKRHPAELGGRHARDRVSEPFGDSRAAPFPSPAPAKQP